MGALFFSSLIATFPGEWRQEPLSHIASWEPGEWNDAIFGANKVRLGLNWPWNTLNLSEFSIYESLKTDDIQRLDKKNYTLSLSGRNLEMANLTGGILGKADLRGAYLRFARLDGAQLNKASFDDAEMQGISLVGAQMQEATLNNARLVGAQIYFAQLEGASLKKAQLKGANLNATQLQKAIRTGARLQEASLERAQLQGAVLENAQLQGASLEKAQLQGASLSSAELQGASLNRAELDGAVLVGAQLQATTMFWAQLRGASIASAELQAASLFRAQLQGASLDGARLQSASLTGAQLQGSSLLQVHLQGAKLDGAYLWRAAFDTPVDPNLLADLRADDVEWKPLLCWKNQLCFPKPWTKSDIESFRQAISDTVPKGDARDAAMKRITKLECQAAKNASAECSESTDAESKTLRDIIQTMTYRYIEDRSDEAAAGYIYSLLKARSENTINILHGVIKNGRLFDLQSKAIKIIDEILEDKLPVSAHLTSSDRDQLIKLKKDSLEGVLSQPPVRDDNQSWRLNLHD